ncbi:MAG: transketolase [Leptospirales bacterium]
MTKVPIDLIAAKSRCQGYRRRILDISQSVTALHVAPAFSCIEIVDAVYNVLMRRNPEGSFQDSFLMSKGHGVMTQYVILEALGIMPKHELDRYCKVDGLLGAHPDYGQPGIEASTGSLGHGLSIAAGMAYADRLQKRERTTFVLLGDGEMQEGSIWEAIMLSSNLNLSNLVVMVDFNDYQGLGRTTETHPHLLPISEKLESFGWESVEVNGHDSGAIANEILDRRGDRPFLMNCRTVKGKGVSFMIDSPIWHYRSPNKEEYAQALLEIDAEEVNL